MLLLSSFIQFTWTCYKKLTLGKKKKKGTHSNCLNIRIKHNFYTSLRLV